MFRFDVFWTLGGGDGWLAFASVHSASAHPVAFFETESKAEMIPEDELVVAVDDNRIPRPPSPPHWK